MGKYLFAICLLLIPLAEAAATDAEDKYQQLLKAAVADPAKADWLALRIAYSETPEFNVMDDPGAVERKTIYETFESGDYVKMLEAAKRIIARDFVDLSGHRYAAAAYKHLNKTSEFEKERTIAEGLIKSVETGDGRSIESALTVISVEEEYTYLIMRGAHVTRQTLLREGGHSYDVFNTVDIDSGQAQDYFFLIDRVLASEAKQLSPQ